MTARIVTAMLVLTVPALAQTAQPPAVRPLGPITNVAPDSFAAVSAAVQVAGGKVYVNDVIAHRVLLFDSALTHGAVIADSSAATANAYGTRPGTLLPYHGDSALFIAPATLSMLVLSPQGAIARVMAMPPANGGIPALIGNIFGTPGFDASGRLAYFAPIRPNIQRFMGAAMQGGPIPPMEPPDSAYIVRFDLAARTFDTAATIRIAKSRSIVNRDEQNRIHVTITAFPPATIDDWAVTSDGAIAVVRGRDYHVDFLNANGTWTSGPRMPFAWEHLSDDDKNALIDSTATAMQAIMDSMPARMQRAGGAAGPGGGAVVMQQERSGVGMGPGAGGSTTTVTVTPGAVAVESRGAGSPEGPRPGGPGGPVSFQMSAPQVTKAALNDVPDYRPPFRQAAVRADVDGNLWIRTNKVVDGRPVFDIVNRQGQLTDRVQLPPFRTIAGFGPGVIYMGVRDSSGVNHLERARIR